MQENTTYHAGLYLRLSQEDDQKGESISIGTQRAILTDFCNEHGYRIHKIYIDDGFSGTNFERPGFRALLEDVERGAVNMVITKDLSRLGRDYIMTGYYSEIFFQAKGVRYIALADEFDTQKGGNEIAPFKNILNDMYARDVSKKIRNAKRQRAKQGLFVGAQTAYGYQKDPRRKSHLIIDPEAAENVVRIFSMAAEGMGNVAIAHELEARRILTPAAYKYQQGDTRFANYRPVATGNYYAWNPGTVGQMLSNRIYLGELTSLKTETTNHKTKQRASVPPERRIVTPNAHEAIISQELFDTVRGIRSERKCSANTRRENLFRGKLFCECCGHPLAISRKQLLHGEADIYLCMHNYLRPDECPKTHRVYHEMLYPYVLQQIQTFAKSMKRRKVNSPLKDYSDITELTPEILDRAVERIEIGHVRKNSRPGTVIQIYWKLK